MARTIKGPSEKRNEILDSARRLVYSKGYEQMTIQDILGELQISKGAFYHYFDSKGALQSFTGNSVPYGSPYLLRVDVTDAAGLIGTAAMRVSVGNEPPSVVGTVAPPPHAFDGSQFTSAGDVPFTVSDPDGAQIIQTSPGGYAPPIGGASRL